MRQPVKELRGNLDKYVKKGPGYYTWWFNKRCVKNLLKALPEIDLNKIKVDENGYAALYFGISTKDINDRAKWHIEPSIHHTKKNGAFCETVSTLRHTLSALLDIDVTKSEQMINDFIDENCEWEWHCSKQRETAEKKEIKELSTNYYPLNIRDNKVVSKTTLAALEKLREDHKK
ncbi:MAG: hypothetical protein K6A41_04590 [Bacteroidales bacterium]|nr:hypothetical protein [Bacteroidales bacterium]